MWTCPHSAARRSPVMEVFLSLKRQTNPATQPDAACILECLIVTEEAVFRRAAEAVSTGDWHRSACKSVISGSPIPNPTSACPALREERSAESLFDWFNHETCRKRTMPQSPA